MIRPASLPRERERPRQGDRTALLHAAAAGLAVPSALVTLVDRSAHRSRTHGVPPDVVELVLRSPEAIARALSALALREAGVRARVRPDLRSALDDLGLADLRAALSAGTSYSVLHPRMGPGGLSALAFAARSVEVARLAGELVAHMPGDGSDHVEAARAAGLLHDIGAAVLVDPPPALLPPGVEPAPADHATLGALMCRAWRLGPDVMEAVRRHEDAAPPVGAVGRAVWMAVRVEAARAGGLEGSLASAAGECGIDPARLAHTLVGDVDPASGDPLDELTPREHEVLTRLAAGEVPKQIAAAIGCSASTVNNHLHHVYGKLGVTGQAHALLVARERGWV